ncbi:MAG: hypothetical protein AAFS10_05620 [Myxococcota bacterium]
MRSPSGIINLDECRAFAEILQGRGQPAGTCTAQPFADGRWDATSCADATHVARADVAGLYLQTPFDID